MSRPRSRPATVGVVVEGQAEYLAFPLLHTEKLISGCPPLKVLCCDGIGGYVEPAGVAKRVHIKVLEHLAAGREKVVVCVDRETRPLCAPGFAQAIHKELDTLLRTRGRSAGTTTVVVADRAFEAWLLADAQGLYDKKLLKKAPGFATFEGQQGKGRACGKGELKDLLGGAYSETRDGPTSRTRAARQPQPGQVPTIAGGVMMPSGLVVQCGERRLAGKYFNIKQIYWRPVPCRTF